MIGIFPTPILAPACAERRKNGRKLRVESADRGFGGWFVGAEDGFGAV